MEIPAAHKLATLCAAGESILVMPKPSTMPEWIVAIGRRLLSLVVVLLMDLSSIVVVSTHLTIITVILPLAPSAA